MANFKLSPNAQEDLERIWLYGVEHWGVDAADAYYAAFIAHFDELAAAPLSYAEVGLRAGYRRSQCGKDSVFYRIDGNSVEIMAILGKQDAEGWL